MLKINPAYTDELYEKISSSPYPFHMNMKLVEIDFDRAVVTMNLDMFHLQPFGIVHGGVIATLIDTATFWAGFMRIPEESGLVNVDLKLNYLKSVVSGKLKAEGNALRSGKSISYSEAKVFDDEGNLIAHGTSSLMTLPGKGIRLIQPKFIDE